MNKADHLESAVKSVAAATTSIGVSLSDINVMVQIAVGLVTLGYLIRLLFLSHRRFGFFGTKNLDDIKYDK